jgi:hypothetical protein
VVACGSEILEGSISLAHKRDVELNETGEASTGTVGAITAAALGPQADSCRRRRAIAVGVCQVVPIPNVAKGQTEQSKVGDVKLKKSLGLRVETVNWGWRSWLRHFGTRLLAVLCDMGTVSRHR